MLYEQCLSPGQNSEEISLFSPLVHCGTVPFYGGVQAGDMGGEIRPRFWMLLQFLVVDPVTQQCR